MNAARSALAVVGLVCIFLFYYFRSGYFALAAIVALFLGFVLVRGHRAKK